MPVHQTATRGRCPSVFHNQKSSAGSLWEPGACHRQSKGAPWTGYPYIAGHTNIVVFMGRDTSSLNHMSLDRRKKPMQMEDIQTPHKEHGWHVVSSSPTEQIRDNAHVHNSFLEMITHLCTENINVFIFTTFLTTLYWISSWNIDGLVFRTLSYTDFINALRKILDMFIKCMSSSEL